MPDSTAAQNLYDALKSFVGAPAAHTPYSVAKDFQALLAGVLALIVASIGYVFAYRGAQLGYSGVMERIDFDRENIETERKTAERERKYGAFFAPAITNAPA
jgi:hypothetical protein